MPGLPRLPYGGGGGGGGYGNRAGVTEHPQFLNEETTEKDHILEVGWVIYREYVVYKKARLSYFSCCRRS